MPESTVSTDDLIEQAIRANLRVAASWAEPRWVLRNLGSASLLPLDETGEIPTNAEPLPPSLETLDRALRALDILLPYRRRDSQ